MRKQYFAILLTVTFIIIVWHGINSTKNQENLLSNSKFFSYPTEELNFAWEKVPLSEKYYFNREKFDKEYLITWFNLYQLFLYIKRAPLYFPYIEKELEKNNIPEDFKYLAVAESGLRNNALSTMEAAGIWQFIKWTWKQYWLRIDTFVDERYNFEKSTQASIRYFKRLYSKFNNWTLVAAAYNRWENWLNRALVNQNVHSYYDLYLNEETSRYIFRILAIKYIMEDFIDQKWDLNNVIWEEFVIPNTETVTVNKVIDLTRWAQEQWQNFKTIKLLNPWIKWDSLPDWNWEIKVLDN